MSIETLLKPKSDEEFYKILTTLDPCDELILFLIKYKRLGLTNILLNNSNVDDLKKNLWKKTLYEFRKYVNENINFR